MGEKMDGGQQRHTTYQQHTRDGAGDGTVQIIIACGTLQCTSSRNWNNPTPSPCVQNWMCLNLGTNEHIRDKICGMECPCISLIWMWNAAMRDDEWALCSFPRFLEPGNTMREISIGTAEQTRQTQTFATCDLWGKAMAGEKNVKARVKFQR